jgi:hypothetical protein
MKVIIRYASFNGNAKWLHQAILQGTKESKYQYLVIIGETG